MADTARTGTIKVDGVLQLRAALLKAPPELRRELTKAMRKAAIPAQNRAEAAVHWAGGPRGLHVRIKALQSGAGVGNAGIVPPIIEFGNKAVIGPGGKVAPHVRRLHRKPALVEAVEGTVGEARAIAETELALLLDRILASEGVLKAPG